MHVSPAKHSFGKRDRRTDRETDGLTDDGQSDPYVSLCLAGDTKMRLGEFKAVYSIIKAKPFKTKHVTRIKQVQDFLTPPLKMFFKDTILVLDKPYTTTVLIKNVFTAKFTRNFIYKWKRIYNLVLILYNQSMCIPYIQILQQGVVISLPVPWGRDQTGAEFVII